jgi:hypothetical protein
MTLRACGVGVDKNRRKETHMTTAYEKMIEALQKAEDDIIKGYGGNKAAATRARKAIQSIRTGDIVQLRDELLAIKKDEAPQVKISSLMPLPEPDEESDSEE